MDAPVQPEMSAASSVLLDQVAQLEWAITGVSAEFGPWDRRRAVDKLRQAAVHKPLPHVWRAAKRSLDARVFKELLSRHLAPARISPKECGASGPASRPRRAPRGRFRASTALLDARRGVA